MHNPENNDIPLTLNDVPSIKGLDEKLDTREDLVNIVEYPLLSACQHLFDLNINTTYSEVHGGTVFIHIDYDNLSYENKTTANELIKKGWAVLEQKTGINKEKHLTVKIIKAYGPTAMVKDVQTYFDGIVREFKPQVAHHIYKQASSIEDLYLMLNPSGNPEDMRKEIPEEEMIRQFVAGGGYWDKTTKRGFPNKIAYQKYTDSLKYSPVKVRPHRRRITVQPSDIIKKTRKRIRIIPKP